MEHRRGWARGPGPRALEPWGLLKGNFAQSPLGPWGQVGGSRYQDHVNLRSVMLVQMLLSLGKDPGR